MIYLNESITIAKVNSIWGNDNIMRKSKIGENKELKEYKKLKHKIKKYIKRFDLTNNKGIIKSFEALISYEETIRRLYIAGVEDIKIH